LFTSFVLNVSGLEQTPPFLPNRIIWFHLDAPSSHAGAPKAARVRHQNRKQIQIPSEISHRRKAESSEDSMKKAFLLFVVPALLVALGFAQTPAASSNTDQTTIKGCLGGSDGNYTVVEDNTGHIFKITTSSVDLKPHLNHDVTLIGPKASGTNSAPADNTLAVTELKMISEHCATTAAASTAPVTSPSEPAGTPAPPPTGAKAPDATVSALPETVSTPAADATAPASATTPAATTVTPAADATTPSATAPAPAVDATPPSATVTTPVETPVTPAAATVPVATIKTPAETATKPAARSRKRSETAAAATATPAVVASTPPATAVIPVATDSSPSEPVSTPAAVAPVPAPPSASNGWGLWLLIAAGVVVLVGGVMFPFVNRWRKQKNLERTDAPNLSFNREASSAQNQSGQTKSDQGMGDRKGPRKAA
jgi:hypothetical protein